MAATFRASTYTNKKEETKVQVSMPIEARDKLVKGDKALTKEFLDVLKAAQAK